MLTNDNQTNFIYLFTIKPTFLINFEKLREQQKKTLGDDSNHSFLLVLNSPAWDMYN